MAPLCLSSASCEQLVSAVSAGCIVMCVSVYVCLRLFMFVFVFVLVCVCVLWCGVLNCIVVFVCGVLFDWVLG